MNVTEGIKNWVTKSCLTLKTPWTIICQAPLSMGFSRQEYWSGLPFLSPGGLSDSGIEPRSSALQADSLLTELQGKPIKNRALVKQSLRKYSISDQKASFQLI